MTMFFDGFGKLVSFGRCDIHRTFTLFVA